MTGKEMAVICLFYWGIFFAALVPAWIKRSHVKAQNRLLERCTGLYVAAVKAWERNNEDTAQEHLARIRRIEGCWRLGDSIAYRIALAFYAIGTGVIGYAVIRVLAILILDPANIGPAQILLNFFGPIELILITAVFGSLHASLSYCDGWTNEWAVADCGARLQRLLQADRQIILTPEPEACNKEPSFDGLKPHQIFGLGPVFSRRHLDHARRRLVRQLHPDLWTNASPSARRAREEAVKRVNAAYDMLRPAVA